MPPIRSERRAWIDIESLTHAAYQKIERGDLEAAKEFVESAFAIAKEMAAQVSRGVHRNPALVIWPNPPGGVRRNPLPATSVRAEEKLSPRVYEIGYKHEEDGQKYKHEFAPGVEMWLVKMGGRQAVVIFGTHGQDVYGDF